MSNHPHRRPTRMRTVASKPRTFVRTTTGTILPAIPEPIYRAGVKYCKCKVWCFTRRGYRRHYVLTHIYGAVI